MMTSIHKSLHIKILFNRRQIGFYNGEIVATKIIEKPVLVTRFSAYLFSNADAALDY